MRKQLSRLLLLLGCLGCVIPITAAAAAPKPVVVASTNFTEQLILANIYADVLQARGVRVKKRLNLGSREVVFPSLESGEIDILPEYSGALLDYLTQGKAKARSEPAVLNALRAQLPSGIVALEPSSAQDKDALVVTRATANRYHLKNISDLKPVASQLTLGGPPEAKTRYVGLKGFKKVYGLKFTDFKALDAGGPLTQGALSSGAIDVAIMFTTQGIIASKGWVLLNDDKHMIPAQNLIPVARKAVLNHKIRHALNNLSNVLSTRQLQNMNKRVTADKADPATVAADWVKNHELGAAN